MEESASGPTREEGLKLLKAGQVDDAIRVLGDLLRQDMDDAQLHMYLGIAYGQKNDKLHAIHHLETSVNLEENPKVLYNLGLIYESSHRIDEAVRQYRMAIQLDPNYTLAQQALHKLQAQFEAEHIQATPVDEAANQPPADGSAPAPAGTQVVTPPAPPSGPPDWAEIQARKDQEVIDQQRRMMKAGLIYGLICGTVFITLGYLAVSMYLLAVPRSFLTVIFVVVGGAVYGGLVGLWIGMTCGGDSAGMQAGAVLGAIGGLVMGLVYGAGVYALLVMLVLGVISGIVGMFIGRMVDASIAQV